MGEYTTVLKNHILNGDITSDDIMTFLNSQDNFMTFGESLTYFIESHFNTDDAYHYLKTCYKEKKIKYSPATLANWFLKDMRPKSKGDNRVNVYKIAFALGLNIELTSELFVEVYHDCPFDLRQINEFVYYCSLNLGYTYQHAEELIKNTEKIFTDNKTEHTVHTQSIIKDAKQLKSDEDIISYIMNHNANFDYYMLSARSVLDDLKEQVKLNKEDLELLKEGRTEDVTSSIAKDYGYRLIKNKKYDDKDNNYDEYGHEFNEFFKNKSLTSYSSMFDLIVYFDFYNRHQNIKNFVKNAKFLDEIKRCFPTAQSLTKAHPTYEEYRKLIILLGSYKFWIELENDIEEVYKKDKTEVLEDYQYEIDDLLSSANLPLLYVGNAYDWMFLYCTVLYKDSSPIEEFRDIMANAFEI